MTEPEANAEPSASPSPDTRAPSDQIKHIHEIFEDHRLYIHETFAALRQKIDEDFRDFKL